MTVWYSASQTLQNFVKQDAAISMIVWSLGSGQIDLTDWFNSDFKNNVYV